MEVRLDALLFDRSPLAREAITQHRAVVVADSSRQVASRAYDVRDGLGLGWLPRHRVASLLRAAGWVCVKAIVDESYSNEYSQT